MDSFSKLLTNKIKETTNELVKIDVLKENPRLPDHIEKLVDWSVCPPVISLTAISDKKTYEDIMDLIENGDLIPTFR